MAPAFGGSDNDAAKRRALRASASGEQYRMSARIEAERPRPLVLGPREPVRLGGRALKTIFAAFKTERSRTKRISSIAAARCGHYALESIR